MGSLIGRQKAKDQGERKGAKKTDRPGSNLRGQTSVRDGQRKRRRMGRLKFRRNGWSA